MKFIVWINGLGFIGLNVLDAWLTTQLLSVGGQELFWWSAWFNSNMLTKGLFALAIVIILVRIGRSRVLWLLNIGISVVVIMNTVSYLTYFAGLCGWFR